MKSVMSHKFSNIPNVEIPRSSFDRSHGVKTTFDGGFLIPILVDEALPGDTFNVRLNAFARMATPIYPIMDNLFMETFFFAVPNRLVWDNWEKFNGEQNNPGDSIDFTIPVSSSGGAVTEGTIGDYFGLPTTILTPYMESSILPFRALALIWNDWFRDENLQDSIVIDHGDGPESIGNYLTPYRRGKRHDYFTSALPWPQKGDSVDLPLGTSAPIYTDEAVTGADIEYQKQIGGGTGTYRIGAGAAFGTVAVGQATETTNIFADLTNATSATINELRQAFQIQKLLERDARGGTRYTEIIRSHFGVTSPDQRLQRPEYLGGGSSMVNINPIAQTSESNTTPQANLAAIGTASFVGHGFTKSFTEHNIIIGLVNVRADLTYQQGLNRMWSRSTRYDFYWPALSHIGEQAILNKEIFFNNDAADEDVFGYQERYAEYRYKPSIITGAFRSNAAASLDAWHLSQDFAARPALNDAFIQDNPPISRVVAVPSEPEFIFDGYFSMICARPMPLYGVPGFIDHF